MLEGKTAFVTGANGGIGREIVKCLCSEHCNVIAQLRCENEDFNLFAQELMKKYPVTVNNIYFNLSDENQIKEGLRQIVKNKINIDVLVNNAGVAHGSLMQMASMSEIHDVFNVNYFAPLQIMQTISRIMAKNKSGSIINISSIAGIDLESGNCAYGASKAALIALTKTTSKELARYNIRVNAIAPGATDTRMVRKMETKAADKMISDSAYGRLATPKEIADVVMFLASDKSAFITGQTIRVDGGGN